MFYKNFINHPKKLLHLLKLKSLSEKHYCKLQIKCLVCLLIEYNSLLIKHNSLLKIIHINFKLVVRKYERGCVHSRKKHAVDGEFVIKH